MWWEDKQLRRLRDMLNNVVRWLDAVYRQGEKIMATQAEIAAELKAINTKLGKIGAETKSLLTKIEELTEVIANGPVSAELQEAVDALKAQADTVDELVEDLPPPVV